MKPHPQVRTSRRDLIFLGAAILLPWLALLQPLHQINHDVAWFYYVARGVLRGGVLYKDFIEPNAPLASLSLIPAVALASTFAISPDWAVELYVLAVASVSMALCLLVLRTLRLETSATAYSLLALATAFILLPDSVFGQREHILAMLLTPYLLACIVACEGSRLPTLLACVIGAAAAFAVGLKPYFVLVPAALELAVLVRGGIRAAWRPQPVALAATLVLIAVVTVLFFPRYLHEVVPWAATLYSGYNASIESLLNRIVFSLGALMLLWLCWPPQAGQVERSARLCLTVGALAAISAFTAQAKGWLYQLFPFLLFLLLLNAGALAATGVLPGRRPADVARWLAARGLAGFAVLAMVYLPYRSVDLSQYSGIEKAIVAEPGRSLC